MTKAIWKFPLLNPDNQVLMPLGAKVLAIQIQDGDLMLWALVDPHYSTTESRMFRIFATGEEVYSPEKWEYIGTFQKSWFVGHVFEWKGL